HHVHTCVPACNTGHGKKNDKDSLTFCYFSISLVSLFSQHYVRTRRTIECNKILVRGAERDMSPEIICTNSIVTLLGLFLLIIPVSISLIIVGTIGLSLIRGWDTALVQLGSTPFSVASSYSLSVIPLFILMGMFLSYSGFGH